MSPADSGSPQATRRPERLHGPSSALEQDPPDPDPREHGPRAAQILLRVLPGLPDNGRPKPVSVPPEPPDSARHSPGSVLPAPLPSVRLRADPAW
ncbi:hypothetical protein AAU01_13980 [Paenarthrobacter aurescens]|uniref:Uncharacterized protein n=1 Tax=Paenarthrobacter aurescens TaxID=43663 RepID=A0A4Y3NBL5_PAEAU|nr:hypothetical protein AAU01_13980 [Paenarthrobacter aurescens]